MASPKEYELRTVDKYWPDSWAKLSDPDKKLVNDKLVNVIKLHPDESEALKGELAGLRSYNRFESDLRIVFAICDECRQQGFTKVNNCPDCNSLKTDTVKLFVVGPHPVYKTLGRERLKRLRKREKRMMSGRKRTI